MTMLVIGLAVLLAKSAAWAHGLQQPVEPPSPPVGALAAGTLVAVYVLGAFRYRVRRSGFGALPAGRFAAGLAGGGLALLVVSPPAETLIGPSFAWHMGQHMLLLLAAPALLAAGRVDIAIAALLPQRLAPSLALIGRLGARPVLSAHLLLVSLWLWHLPGPWHLAETNDYVHLVDHAMLLGASILYWRAVFDRTRAASLRPAATMLGSLILIVGTGFLGAILTLAPVTLYGPGVTLSDQQVGGILMWIPCGLAYAAALLWALDRWLARLGDGSPPLLTTVR